MSTGQDAQSVAELAEYLKTAIPIIVSLITLVGISITAWLNRQQFIRTERRIEDHFNRQSQLAADADALKAKLSARQAELLRIKGEVTKAADAIAKLVKIAVSDGDNPGIVRSTAAAFQDVAPLFNTMSEIKANWYIKTAEGDSLHLFEAAITKFFIRLDFEPPESQRAKYHSELKKFAQEVEVTRTTCLAQLKAGW